MSPQSLEVPVLQRRPHNNFIQPDASTAWLHRCLVPFGLNTLCSARVNSGVMKPPWVREISEWGSRPYLQSRGCSRSQETGAPSRIATCNWWRKSAERSLEESATSAPSAPAGLDTTPANQRRRGTHSRTSFSCVLSNTPSSTRISISTQFVDCGI